MQEKKRNKKKIKVKLRGKKLYESKKLKSKNFWVKMMHSNVINQEKILI